MQTVTIKASELTAKDIRALFFGGGPDVEIIIEHGPQKPAPAWNDYEGQTPEDFEADETNPNISRREARIRANVSNTEGF